MASASPPTAASTRPTGWSSRPGPGSATLVPGLSRSPCPSGRCWPGSSRRGPSCSRPSASRSSTCQVEEGRYYGFPVFGVPGFKFGRYHHLDEQVDPETIDREPNPRDEALLRDLRRALLPRRRRPDDGAAEPACSPTARTSTSSSICTRTTRSVVVASPCSGHGFKFCSVVGEIAGRPRRDAARPATTSACSASTASPRAPTMRRIRA